MNIQRFGFPVIIAAALHGALFLVSAEPEEVVITAPTKPVPITFTPIQEEPIATPPEDSSDSDTAASSPANPLPTQQDVIPPLTPDHGITVPITSYRPAIDPVKDLRGVTGLPGGTDIAGSSFGPPSILRVDRLDRVPRAVAQPAPNYPDLLRREGVDGSVTVEFVVGTDGRVVQAEAVKWSRREFVEPAVRAVWRWRFEPGTQNGRKVSFRMAVPIEFSAAQ